MADAHVVAANPLAGERMERLLAAIADAPDHDAAAARLAASMAEVVGAAHAGLWVLDEDAGGFSRVALVGDAARLPAPRVAVDADHPLVVCGLSLWTLACAGAPTAGDAASGSCVLVPLPQPLFAGAPAPLSAADAASRAGHGCTVVTAQHGERRRRVGLAPYGVLAVALATDAGADGARRASDAAAVLLPTATLAGPILARAHAVARHRDAATRLDRQRDLLTAIINSLPDPIVLSVPGRDDAGEEVMAKNRRAGLLLDEQPGDSAGRRRALELNSLLVASYLAVTRRDANGDARATNGDATRELTLVDPEDGDDLQFELGLHPLSMAAGRPDARLVVLRDVTELRHAAEALEGQVQRARLAEYDARRERDRLDLILDYVADPIVVTDADGAMAQLNRSAERLFPFGPVPAAPAPASADAGASPSVDGRGGDGARARNLAALATFVRGFKDGAGAMHRARLALEHPTTGATLPVEAVAGRVAGRPGEPPVVVSVLHDLTTQSENERLYEELKGFSTALEGRVREATADLAAQNLRLQAQSRELERANRLKSEFLASMSHELRTPINALIGYSALILDRIYGELTPKQEEGLRRIQRSAQQLLALINDILDLAKIEAGRLAVHLEPTPIPPIVREVVLLAERSARAKGLTIAAEVAPELPPARTDAAKLRQALQNLLSNAVKFTAEGGVTVRAAREGDRIRVDVVDTGIGIQPGDLDAIWADFRQLDQSRTREYGGTGLGLSIVRRLVERLGGEVRVASRVGEGSVFSILVPVAE